MATVAVLRFLALMTAMQRDLPLAGNRRGHTAGHKGAFTTVRSAPRACACEMKSTSVRRPGS
jgi:hypothetical protein